MFNLSKNSTENIENIIGEEIAILSFILLLLKIRIIYDEREESLLHRSLECGRKHLLMFGTKILKYNMLSVISS